LKIFLFIFSASFRPPSGGFTSIGQKLNISQGGGNTHLPQSGTCGFRLTIPVYSDKEIMKDKLV
jgi:hypothetical protein